VNKEQVFEILSLFRDTYNNFHFDQQKLNTWHRLLKDKDPEVILKNADKLAMESKFPPSLSELVNLSDQQEEIPSGPAVPGYEETQEMLKKREKNKAEAASPETVEREMANIRKILGIRNDACGNARTN
jgi:hypothetical protein